MRFTFVVFAFSLIVAGQLSAVPRCAGHFFQVLTTQSGAALQLPVVSVQNALDYEVQIANSWDVVADGTFHLRGTILHRSFRSPDATPVIRETLYATADVQSVYIVVTAHNGAQYLCAQDFQVLVEPDPALSRNATRMIVPVAASARGANNSTFKTRVVLENRWSHPITGKIMFHPAGVAGSSNDPSLAYSLAAGAFIAYDDVVASLHASGLGSLDILPDVTESGSHPAPIVRADVLSLAPNDGEFSAHLPVVTSTSGYEGAVFGTARFLVEPSRNRRFAIGIRTLADPVKVTALLRTADGTERARAVRTYPAEFYEQSPLGSWFFDQEQPGDNILFFVARNGQADWVSGAIVFLAETDNTTNDVSVVIPEAIATVRQPVIACSSGYGCSTLVR